MDLLTALLLGNFVFTASSFAWSWKLYCLLNVQVNNHLKTEIARLNKQLHVNDLCDGACQLCTDEVK